jgi:hypothetical protein
MTYTCLSTFTSQTMQKILIWYKQITILLNLDGNMSSNVIMVYNGPLYLLDINEYVHCNQLQSTQIQQDSLWSYNITFRCIHIMIVAVKKQQILDICLCVCVHECVCMWVSTCTGMCMYVALLIQHATRYVPYCDVIRGPSGSTLFFDIIS